MDVKKEEIERLGILAKKLLDISLEHKKKAAEMEKEVLKANGPQKQKFIDHHNLLMRVSEAYFRLHEHVLIEIRHLGAK